jgi:hypothetical protein
MWKFRKLIFGSDIIDFMYVFSADLTLVVTLDLEHSPQIVSAHVMVDLKSKKQRLSE